MQANLAENIAAISFSFYENRRAYNRFYRRHCDTLSGFPGVWNFVRAAAEIFTNVEKAGLYSYEYIDAIDHFASKLVRAKDLTTLNIRKLAQEALSGHAL